MAVAAKEAAQRAADWWRRYKKEIGLEADFLEALKLRMLEGGLSEAAIRSKLADPGFLNEQLSNFRSARDGLLGEFHNTIGLSEPARVQIEVSLPNQGGKGKGNKRRKS